ARDQAGDVGGDVGGHDDVDALGSAGPLDDGADTGAVGGCHGLASNNSASGRPVSSAMARRTAGGVFLRPFRQSETYPSAFPTWAATAFWVPPTRTSSALASRQTGWGIGAATPARPGGGR